MCIKLNKYMHDELWKQHRTSKIRRRIFHIVSYPSAIFTTWKCWSKYFEKHTRIFDSPNLLYRNGKFHKENADYRRRKQIQAQQRNFLLHSTPNFPVYSQFCNDRPSPCDRSWKPRRYVVLSSTNISQLNLNFGIFQCHTFSFYIFTVEKIPQL